MKLFNIAENDEGPVNWNNVESKNTEDALTQALKRQAAARHQVGIFAAKLEPYEKHVVTTYGGPANFSIPVSHSIKYRYTWWGIPQGTPRGEDLWKAIEFYVDRYNHAQKLEGKYGRLATKLKKIHRTEIFNDLKYKIPETKIPSADVPRRIFYTATNYFNNPYWNRDDVLSRYAGPVGHFPDFNTTEKNTLVELEQALRRHGILGLTKMYGCTVKIGKWTENRFVVYGADDRLIWKHIGGNVIYLDGKKVSISYLTSTSNIDKQKALLVSLKEPKKVSESIEEPSEWENVPIATWANSQNYAKMNQERRNKVQAIKRQDDILIRRLGDLADEYPKEILSRGIPDPNEKYFEEMDPPKEYVATPQAYQKIVVPGSWFWEDMRFDDLYSDAYEEFYVLKSSPRLKHIVNILMRHNELMSMLQKLGVWPRSSEGRP